MSDLRLICNFWKGVVMEPKKAYHIAIYILNIFTAIFLCGVSILFHNFIFLILILIGSMLLHVLLKKIKPGIKARSLIVRWRVTYAEVFTLYSCVLTILYVGILIILILVVPFYGLLKVLLSSFIGILFAMGQMGMLTAYKSEIKKYK